MRGPWYDTAEGVLVVDEAAREQSPHTIRQLGELLLDDTFDLNDYVHVTRINPRAWTEAGVLACGAWLNDIVSAAVPGEYIKQRHINRANALGVGPSPATISKLTHTQTLAEFRRKIGAEAGRARYVFADWTLEDYVRYASKVEAEAGGRPKESDYDAYAKARAHKVPSLAMVQRFGVERLNALIGYPNYEAWEDDEFVDWGVKFMSVNDGLLPTRPFVNYLSSVSRGPGHRPICRHFGTMDEFERQVIEQCSAAQHRKQIKLQQYVQQIEDGALPGAFVSLADEELLRAGGVVRLVVSLVGEVNAQQKTALADGSLANAFWYIRSRRKRLKEADIDMAAIELDVYDDIRPVQNPLLPHLRIPGWLLQSRSRRYALERFEPDPLMQRTEDKAEGSPATGDELPLWLLGRVIRHRRMVHGYSRRELADRAYVSTGYLRALEAGGRYASNAHSNPSESTLASLARALEIEPDTLYGLVEKAA